jgi:hypothetical protein
MQSGTEIMGCSTSVKPRAYVVALVVGIKLFCGHSLTNYAEVILERLPDRIRTALIERAIQIEYPIEAVMEMAIASFLDSEALGFADCKPGRGQ